MKKQGGTYVADEEGKAPGADVPPFGNESVVPAPSGEGEGSGEGVDEPPEPTLIPSRIVKFDSMLKCVLNTDELVRYAKEMGDVNAAVTRLETEAKSVAKQYASKVAEKEARRSNLGEMLTNGFEHRSVLCNRIFDYESGQVLEVRTDNGDVVDTRKMTQAELQLEFDLFEKNKGAA